MKVELIFVGTVRIRTEFVFSLFKIVSQLLPRYKSGEVSIAFVNDQTIKKLNTKYRQRPSVTDVLSFAEREGDKIPVKKSYLGEIIISMPQARRQAGQNKHSVQVEIVVLLIHGFLHLVGYDHLTDKQAALMGRLEKKISRRFFKSAVLN